VSDLEAGWAALLAVTPTGWYIGRPRYHDERDEWLLYAFDPSERAVVGVKSREWMTVAATEMGVGQEMARCLKGLRTSRTSERGNADSSPALIGVVRLSHVGEYDQGDDGGQEIQVHRLVLLAERAIGLCRRPLR
jgi:hypothetical protein